MVVMLSSFVRYEMLPDWAYGDGEVALLSKDWVMYSNDYYFVMESL